MSLEVDSHEPSKKTKELQEVAKAAAPKTSLRNFAFFKIFGGIK